MSVCSLCGFVFAKGGPACRERSCPLAGLGCTLDHCPRCGYAIPDVAKSALVRAARWVLALGGARAGAPSTLARLNVGGKARVASVRGNSALEARLAAQGLVAGVEVTLVHRWPSYIVEMGETALALERRVAEAVFLEPVENPASLP